MIKDAMLETSMQGEDLKGDKVPLWCALWATVGYVMTSFANLNAGFVTLDLVKNYHLIDTHTALAKTLALGKVDIEIDVNFYIDAYLPFKMNALNLQTVLLIITSMSVLRGHFKQSKSAFRLGAVTSLLAVIVQLPAVVGNLETFSWAHLWWWDDSEKCAEFHTGLPFFNADHKVQQTCLMHAACENIPSTNFVCTS